MGDIPLLSEPNEGDLVVASASLDHLRSLQLFAKSALSGRKCVCFSGGGAGLRISGCSFHNDNPSPLCRSFHSARGTAARAGFRRGVAGISQPRTQMALTARWFFSLDRCGPCSAVITFLVLTNRGAYDIIADDISEMRTLFSRHGPRDALPHWKNSGKHRRTARNSERVRCSFAREIVSGPGFPPRKRGHSLLISGRTAKTAGTSPRGCA